MTGRAAAARPDRAVFFDIGDTLVCRPTVGPGRRIAEALGLPRAAARRITELVFREAFDGPVGLAARLAQVFPLEGNVAAALAPIWAAQIEEPIEVAGATACVAAVRRTGAHVGVISNIWAPYALGFRRACPDVLPLVDAWHLSFQVGTAKPDSAIFHAALAAAGVAPGAAVMVGDDLAKDVRPACALGMRAVWVPGEGVAAGVELPAGAVVATDLHEAARAVVALVEG